MQTIILNYSFDLLTTNYRNNWKKKQTKTKQLNHPVHLGLTSHLWPHSKICNVQLWPIAISTDSFTPHTQIVKFQKTVDLFPQSQHAENHHYLPSVLSDFPMPLNVIWIVVQQVTIPDLEFILQSHMIFYHDKAWQKHTLQPWGEYEMNMIFIWIDP